MNHLTPKEQAMLNFIVENIRKNGYSPSIRDIRTALDIKSTSTVHTYLERLEKKGYIQKENGKSRTLRVEDVPNPRRQNARIPILGKVTAGIPILAIENHDGYIDFPLTENKYSPNNLFALRVSGESMIEAGIFDGDIVVVDKRPHAENGEIIVALIEDEATIKTFYREENYFRLQPENKTMEPIYTDDLFVLGKVIANFRFY
jgi:SOS regulatory protein LexA